MDQQSTQPDRRTRAEAMDISDFVYGATGTRLRRLTMPDGSHWFPAVDVCRELGYSNSRTAVRDHVPDRHRDIIETVAGAYGLSIPAGREWRRDLNVIDLQGLILLVNGSTKPSCQPFKEWVSEVVQTIQRTGSYRLPTAEIQPPEPTAPVAYAMPEQMVEAIVRLEERTIRLDEEFASVQRERLAMEREHLALQRESLSIQREMLAAQQTTARSAELIADRFGALPANPEIPDGRPSRPTAEAVLADWKARMSVTEDVWAVALAVAPLFAANGELRMPLESIAAKTGLSANRVNECLRFMRKHACIHPTGASGDGVPVYVLNRP
ncbi:Bro-N domain-containing protein [Streptomyces sp. SID10853]|uniref:BRO-N domain-containing protein n=1 Tax=Streptomyces sp. SID10853 TaxID=2706028 RepID=UPI0013C25E4F|nr:Bro-N domain-containing protein [Streptomyces sp. SID10853]NDZ81379.1 Bro-N domain-containing protein [Streptomyces sp. SID10853]